MQLVPGMHAADHLQQVQKELAQYEQREQQIRQQLSEKSLQAVEQIKRSDSTLPFDEPAQRPLPDLLYDAKVLDTGAKYLEVLEVSQTCCQTPASVDTRTVHAKLVLVFSVHPVCRLSQREATAVRAALCNVDRAMSTSFSLPHVNHHTLFIVQLECRNCSKL